MKILQAVTDDYITTAEPVGSRTIARKYGLGVSPATIRNEMSDLEELGYLEQPHTSAGRVPSDKGYRFYVDELMDPTEMTEAELESLRELMIARHRAIEQMIHGATRVLSALSQYAAVVLAPRLSETIVRRIELTRLDDHNFLMVLVTEPGFVQNQIIEVPYPIEEEALRRLSEKINAKLIGKSLKAFTRSFVSELRNELDAAPFFDDLVDVLIRALDQQGSEKVYMDGALHLFEQPEFRDMDRAKSLLGFLSEEKTLASVLGELSQNTSIRVTIGSEHTHTEMHDCSLVTATYKLGNTVIGAVGVVGPTRLDYAKVVGVVRGLADSLSEVLTSMSSRT